MKRHFESLTRKAARVIKHWWLYLLCGLLCVASGIVVFVFPIESYLILGVIFGVLMLLTGVTQLIVAGVSGNYFTMKGYLVAGGILDMLLGIFLCINPPLTLVVMPVLLGLWLLYHSFMIMAFGGDLETFNISGSGWTVAGGVLLMILSILVLVNPMSAGASVVIALVGTGLIVFGLLLCTLAFTFKNIHRSFDPELA